MKELEKAKERIKDALIRLERAIEAKNAKLELENQALREELNKLKLVDKSPSSRKGAAKITVGEEENLLDKSVLSEVDLSLKELKKLMG